MNRILRTGFHILPILLVTLVALGTRLIAVQYLPIDYDEDDYFGAGQHYAHAIRTDNLQEIINYSYNYEHPPLTKILYGLTILNLPEVPQVPELDSTAPPVASLPEPHFYVDRTLSAIFGTLEVFALSILNPLAGLFLGIHTWQIKYTSQIMLEPLPALTSLLAVLFYSRSRSRWNIWMAASAIFLGLTAAGKYTYCIVGIAILAHWLSVTKPEANLRRPDVLWRWLAGPLAWVGLAFLVFFATDPRLWTDPIGRLKESVLYHAGYAESQHVKNAGYPLWQPLVWLAESDPWDGVFIVSIDMLISLLAILGWKRTWQTQRVFALWLVLDLVFLLLWPTKWPQYILTLTAPLTLSAAIGFQEKVWHPLISGLKNLRRRKAIQEPLLAEAKPNQTRKALPWLIPGLLAMAVITLYPMVYQIGMAMTDFSILSIRDGLTGGVWREVGKGLTFQAQSLDFNIVPDNYRGIRIEVRDRGALRAVGEKAMPLANNQVHFIGPQMFLDFLLNSGGSLLVFNFLWTLLSVGLQGLLGVSLALMLERQGVRFKTFWTALFILPWAIPEFIGALVWFHVFEPTNGWLALGLHTHLIWPQNMDQTMGVLLLAATWMGFPFMMFAAIAGLKLIPKESYDAAAVDGAGAWQRFRYVTWPLLLPLLAPAILIRSIFAFNQFYLFYVMRSPLSTIATQSFYIFNTNTGGGQFAISAAINLVAMVILIGFVAALNRWNKASEGVSYA